MRAPRRGEVATFFGGYLLGRKRNRRLLVRAVPVLLVLGMAGVAAVQVWWSGLSGVQRVLVTLVGVALLAAFLAPRLARAVPARRRSAPGGPLPRTLLPWFSVYVITEWRDKDGTVLPRTFPTDPAPRGASRHLVYIGKANELDRRMEQHLRDRPWFHDQLMFSVVRCVSESGALQVESALVEAANRSAWAQDWPRENERMNPRYHDPKERQRRAELLEAARRSPAVNDRRALA